MEKLSKVIAGLECCLSEDKSCSENCPYFKGEYVLDGCMDDLMAEALEVLSGIRGFLEGEIRIFREWQNDKMSQMYDGVEVGRAEAAQLRYNHIRFCERLLKIGK